MPTREPHIQKGYVPSVLGLSLSPALSHHFFLGHLSVLPRCVPNPIFSLPLSPGHLNPPLSMSLTGEHWAGRMFLAGGSACTKALRCGESWNYREASGPQGDGAGEKVGVLPVLSMLCHCPASLLEHCWDPSLASPKCVCSHSSRKGPVHTKSAHVPPLLGTLHGSSLTGRQARVLAVARRPCRGFSALISHCSPSSWHTGFLPLVCTHQLCSRFRAFVVAGPLASMGDQLVLAHMEAL